ncbi:MAG: chorismate mutase [Elusimicrobia bacterium]|nr:chorismate mutase [Elusimicrobiota bacterium]
MGTMEKKADKKLVSLREKIDCLDKKIFELLSERFILSLKTAHFKKNIKDKKREREIFFSLRKNIKDKSLKPYVTKVYKKIIELSVKYQKKYAYKLR